MRFSEKLFRRLRPRGRAARDVDPRQPTLAEHKRAVREGREAQDYPSRGGGVVGR